jgi:AraC family transcriptional regulator
MDTNILARSSEMATQSYARRVEPLAIEWCNFTWNGGAFDAGRRDFTKEVEGLIVLPHDLVLVTLSGGARRLEVTTDCGHRYAGNDFPGAVSFVPANCGRRLKMHDVDAEWATISLRPDLLRNGHHGLGGNHPVDVPAFTNVHDPFVSGLVAEIARLFAAHGRLESVYCETMAAALAQYLPHRYGKAGVTIQPADLRLPLWRVRRITDYVEAHLGETIHVADLARTIDLSVGHFHRALRATLGVTPLEFVTHRRIERARRLLATASTSITELSLRVGFASPNHFARLFRRATGLSPSEYRNGVRKR